MLGQWPLYLSACPGYFVNDVSEDDILIICVAAHFLPLWVLPQSDIVTQERVANAGKVLVVLVKEQFYTSKNLQGALIKKYIIERIL